MCYSTITVITQNGLAVYLPAIQSIQTGFLIFTEEESTGL